MTVILLVQEFLHLWKCSVGSNLHPQNEFLHKNIYLNIVIYIVQKYQIDEGERTDGWTDLSLLLVQQQYFFQIAQRVNLKNFIIQSVLTNPHVLSIINAICIYLADAKSHEVNISSVVPLVLGLFDSVPLKNSLYGKQLFSY